MPFTITTHPQHHLFTATGADTLLEEATRAGIHLPYGCRGGYCGNCRAKILSGYTQYSPDHYPEGHPPGITDTETAHGYVLLCQAHACSDLTLEVNEITLATDLPIKTLPVRVMQLQRLTPEVMRMRLQLPATERLDFLAGQYITILLKDGQQRSFSLANAPYETDALELHIRHIENGFFTSWVFSTLQEKTLLRVRGPLGTFFIREDSSQPLILVGGSTGFAPLKSMIEQAFYKGLTRPIHLFWGVRSPQDLYSDLPAQWAQQHDPASFQYTPVFSEPTPGNPSGTWVHQAVIAQYPDLSPYQLYMAGPPAMIHAAKPAFLQQGLAPAALFYDSFELTH